MIIDVKAKLQAAGLSELDESASTALMIAIEGVARGAREEWVRLAQNRLKSGRETYINGLRQAGSFLEKDQAGGIKTFEISLVGKMPNNFEFGMPSFDMKEVRPGWLFSPKAKMTKDGRRYRVIPFRHSSTSGARLAYSGKAKEANLQNELRRVIKKYAMDQMVKGPTGRPMEGAVRRVPTLAKRGKIASIFASASTHPLSGLTRIQKNYPGGSQGMLMTFRTMVEGAEGKWIHPGIKAANLMNEVEAWANSELDRIVKMFEEGS